MRLPHEEKKRHAILTCYDDRIDAIVDREINRIRSQGGLLHGKDIIRPAGGAHMLAGKTDCRNAFYEMIASLYNIAGTRVFHIWPHTNCRYCGTHFEEKLGNGSQSDLRFHVKSAEKMWSGVTNHFSNLTGGVPEIDVRIVLTIDQYLVTIDEARALLPHVPEHSHHGSPCIGHHPGPYVRLTRGGTPRHDAHCVAHAALTAEHPS